MADFNLLLVEDNEKEIQTFKDTLERYTVERERPMNVTIAKKLDETLNLLSNDFDGAIVDLKLGRDGDAGNKIIETLQSKFRVPIAVFTANPANVTVDVKVFPRASVEYDVPLDFLFDMYNTGLTKIFGGKGYIEKAMNKVFWYIVDTQLDTWKSYNAQRKETEKALLRFIVNHIVELVDEDEEKYFPEEMYIAPIISKTLKTGNVVTKKGTDQYFIVLSPACDLVSRAGNIKTDRILVCLIEKTDMNLVQSFRESLKTEVLEADSDEIKKDKNEKIEKAKLLLSQLQHNSYSPYFHYLPETKIFTGGFINFRKIEAFKPKDFKKNFDAPITQISSAFMKDIIARFSSYYARQGQPDFDLDNLQF